MIGGSELPHPPVPVDIRWEKWEVLRYSFPLSGTMVHRRPEHLVVARRCVAGRGVRSKTPKIKFRFSVIFAPVSPSADHPLLCNILGACGLLCLICVSSSFPPPLPPTPFLVLSLQGRQHKALSYCSSPSTATPCHALPRPATPCHVLPARGCEVSLSAAAADEVTRIPPSPSPPPRCHPVPSPLDPQTLAL